MRFIVIQKLGKSKVRNSSIQIAIEQNVAWLDIPMYDSGWTIMVQISKPFCCSQYNIQACVPIQLLRSFCKVLYAWDTFKWHTEKKIYQTRIQVDTSCKLTDKCIVVDWSASFKENLMMWGRESHHEGPRQGFPQIDNHKSTVLMWESCNILSN